MDMTNRTFDSTQDSVVVMDYVQALRKKLLDLSLRNPLIATKLESRTSAYIRIVDTTADALWEIISKETMYFKPLPSAHLRPLDETTPEFERALSKHKTTNSSELPLTEVELRDQVRKLMNLEDRVTKNSFSQVIHARNNLIDPSYELKMKQGPIRSKVNSNVLQTLIPQETFINKLDNFINKHRTCIQETGVNSVNIVFGFIEWQDLEQSNTVFSPLLLVPVTPDKEKSTRGYEYLIESNEESPIFNPVLLEKFAQEGISIPVLDEEDTIEDFYKKIELSVPKGWPLWKLHRQVIVGIFPSSSFTMYQDLEPQYWEMKAESLIRHLLNPEAEELGVQIVQDEQKDKSYFDELELINVVLDSDSSQLSVIHDVLRGRNLSVEGPPGTGKSQTIVNTIAAAIDQGKKVLFVAEKTAAIDVVKSRLEACGLGGFIMALQAGRHAKGQTYKNLAVRRAMENNKSHVTELATLKEQLKTTKQTLGDYTSFLNQPYREMNQSIHDILWRAIKLKEDLGLLTELDMGLLFPAILTMSDTSYKNILHKCSQLDLWYESVAKIGDCWRYIGLCQAHPLMVDDIMNITQEINSRLTGLINLREELIQYDLSKDLAIETMDQITHTLEQCKSIAGDEISIYNIANELNFCYFPPQIVSFTNQLTKIEQLRKLLGSNFRNLDQNQFQTKLKALTDLMSKYDFKTTSVCERKKHLDLLELELMNINMPLKFLNSLASLDMPVEAITIAAVADLIPKLSSLSGRNLVFRTPHMCKPTARATYNRAIDELDGLKKRELELTIFFAMEKLPKLEDLLKLYEIFTTANIFSSLRKTYRSARKQYSSITKSGWLNRRHTTEALKNLISWLEELKAFERKQSYKELFGSGFQGYHTDICDYEKLVDFYSYLSDEYMSHVYSPLKEYLYGINLDQLKAIHGLGFEWHSIKEFVGHNREMLSSEKFNSENQINEYLEDQRLIESIISDLELYKEVTHTELGKLYALHLDYSRWQKELLENTDILVLFNNYYKGRDLSSNIVEKTIKLAVVLREVPHLVASTIVGSMNHEKNLSLSVLLCGIKSEELGLNQKLQILKHRTSMSATFDEIYTTTDCLRRWSAEALHQIDSISILARINRETRQLLELGLELPNQLYAPSSLKPRNAKFFENKAYKLMISDIYQISKGLLDDYTGEELNELRSRYAELDTKLILLTKQQVKYKLIEHARPSLGFKGTRKSDYTELALIDKEIQKKTKHIPLRQLISKSAKSLLELQPCWMMSPLAVSQFLPRDIEKFDLLIIDEASQMKPQDAFGSLLRSKQIMVVGDLNQLPPSDFFKAIVNEEEGTTSGHDIVSHESILQLASTNLNTTKRLQWHYRSKHSSLIQFCNHHVYGNNLKVFVAPNQDSVDLGVRYLKVDGYYNERTNLIEAETMVKFALEFMSSRIDCSLGLVVSNLKQQELIQQLFETELLSNSSAREYIAFWDAQNSGLEYFFVKNLENVQGDERDVILIGTVYGPEQYGAPVMQRFGPINGASGKRRLNVLFTRAKKQIVTFSSLTAADVRANHEDVNSGVYMLKKWLEYSAAGGILETGTITHKSADSPFEECVIHKLKLMGYHPEPQVGVKGFYIDIGLKHPSWPHGYVLGIECDGASYHSTKSARDRDRLRQQVLEGLGWCIYRIWSTDWFANPKNESLKLKEFIEARVRFLQKELDRLIN